MGNLTFGRKIIPKRKFNCQLKGRRRPGGVRKIGGKDRDVRNDCRVVQKDGG